MTRALLLFSLLTFSMCSFSQSQFYVGLKGGISGCFYQYNAAATNSYVIGGINSTTRLTSRGPSIPAVVELIYSIGKFRVGYQFEYERILTTAYKYRTFNSAYSISDTTVNNPNITQHFFCHNLLLEYQLYTHKKLKLVPDLSFGYFHGVSAATEAPYDFASLNQNRFKISVAMNIEYQLGQVSIVAAPQYGLVPIKSIYDPNQKGYMHFIGLHVGVRIGCMRLDDPTTPDGRKKKKKKEYVNPEEEDN